MLHINVSTDDVNFISFHITSSAEDLDMNRMVLYVYSAFYNIIHDKKVLILRWGGGGLTSYTWNLRPGHTAITHELRILHVRNLGHS